MYAETSIRDGFVIRDQRYYHVVWEKFIRSGLAQALIAEVDHEPVAGLILFVFAKKAWYLYGMSRQAHREKMPNYLLQWEAICAAKAQGCEIYDLWGAPDEFDERDPMWGVYRFKEGLGGKVVRHIGAWDLPVRPISYKISLQILPKILAVLRQRGIDRTRQQVNY
jgi:lipid II:glycine glycyltransferase (peptidoglycan interpeptide bridge formation enzyme)